MLKNFYHYRSALAVGLIFLQLNVAFGSWLSRLPEIQRKLDLSEGQLGVILLGMPIGGFIATTFSRRLIGLFPAGRVALWGILIFSFLMILPPLATRPEMLIFLLFIVGLSDGLTNVAMNSAAADIERFRSLKIMSSCHGMFSLGGFIGALIGGAAGYLGVPLYLQMVVIALAGLIILAPMRRSLEAIPVSISSHKSTFRLPSIKLVHFMLIGLFIMIGEGAISDWAPIYLTNELSAGPMIAALGFAGFSLAMATGRFSGDRIRALFTSRSLIRNGAFVSAGGLLLAMSTSSSTLCIIGFTLAGVGFAAGVPILFLEAAKLNPDKPAIGIAAVANAGIIGFLAAPPAIGFIAEAWSLQVSLLIVAGLAFLAGVSSHFNLS